MGGAAYLGPPSNRPFRVGKGASDRSTAPFGQSYPGLSLPAAPMDAHRCVRAALPGLSSWRGPARGVQEPADVDPPRWEALGDPERPGPYGPSIGPWSTPSPGPLGGGCWCPAMEHSRTSPLGPVLDRPVSKLGPGRNFPIRLIFDHESSLNRGDRGLSFSESVPAVRQVSQWMLLVRRLERARAARRLASRCVWCARVEAWS